ncbi:peptidase domain-containing ABC transporter [Staphylococcus borealis]|uniref:peptidase domain-containing ABC transporter n=1 Tax=Staphylococcus borealis TaxID=2742203 RepID=UPI002DB978FE|nr:peptidase domain-containing ABC transporter [Staphylococcus borealis]MEB7367591.1 peptidase domain-containing ABC transporter [Staphylococcus borealis]
MKLKYLEQFDENDCGPACLSMLNHFYHNSKITISKIREYSATDKNGTSLYGMIKGGEKLGLELEGVETDDIHNVDNTDLPLIAHIINQDGYLHFVIIEKIKKDSIRIIDPSFGRKTITIQEFHNIWTGVLLLVDKNTAPKIDQHPRKEHNLLLEIIKDNKVTITKIFLLSIIINLLGISSTLYFKYLIDSIIPSKVIQNLNKLSLAVLLIYISFSVCSFIRYQITLKLSLKIDIKFMRDYFNHILYLPVNFFETRKYGEITSRFNDISKIREALSAITITLLVDSLMVIVGGVLLAFQSTKLFILSLILIPLYLLAGLSFKKKLKKYNKLVMEEEARVDSFLFESLSGYNVIKSFVYENLALKKGVKKFKNLIHNIYSLNLYTNIQMSLNTFMKMIITLIILWFGSILIINNELSLGSLLTFNALVVYYLDPIENLINLQPKFQSALVSSRRFLDIMEIDKEKNNNHQKNNFNETLALNNVCFRYGFDENTLSNISMNISKSEKVAIIGESGSGKSTLAKLIVNFYEDYNGTITIDKTPIDKISKKSLRTIVSYVSQENFMFGTSIKENLLMGKECENWNEIEEACEIACIDEFIKSLPQGFDTTLHTGGSNFSGGQLQRLALARAILKKSDILILDEATSSLDAYLEKQILKNIVERLKEKTVIIITHRLNTIKKLDKIYTLKNGVLVEEGKHEELIMNESEYYRLWKTQS